MAHEKVRQTERHRLGESAAEMRALAEQQRRLRLDGHHSREPAKGARDVPPRVERVLGAAAGQQRVAASGAAAAVARLARGVRMVCGVRACWDREAVPRGGHGAEGLHGGAGQQRGGAGEEPAGHEKGSEGTVASDKLGKRQRGLLLVGGT